MSIELSKSGSKSIILGKNLYGSFMPVKRFQLLKLVKSKDEFKHLGIVKQIKNCQKYYSIPDEEIKMLDTSDDFYKKMVNLFQERKLSMPDGPFHCYYIEYAGNQNLQQSLVTQCDSQQFKYWKSYKQILRFVKKIMTSLQFLHQNKLCHLDMKPEHIMINTTMNTFKLVDFSSTSLYPFDDYVEQLIGPPGFIPKFFKNESKIFPTHEPNDLVVENEQYPLETDRSLVYKIDSFCLGKILLLLKNTYKEYKTYYCYNRETKNETKLDNIIMTLLESDCRKRLTIQECLTKFY